MNLTHNFPFLCPRQCLIRMPAAALFVLLSLMQYINIQPLFTLGSVYSTSASGAEQTIETNNSNIT